MCVCVCVCVCLALVHFDMSYVDYVPPLLVTVQQRRKVCAALDFHPSFRCCSTAGCLFPSFSHAAELRKLTVVFVFIGCSVVVLGSCSTAGAVQRPGGGDQLAGARHQAGNAGSQRGAGRVTGARNLGGHSASLYLCAAYKKQGWAMFFGLRPCTPLAPLVEGYHSLVIDVWLRASGRACST